MSTGDSEASRIIQLFNLSVGIGLVADPDMKSRLLLAFSFAASLLVASVPTEAAVSCGPRTHAVVRHVRLSNGRLSRRTVCVASSRRVVRRVHYRAARRHYTIRDRR